jgi:hypothetical protein
MEINKIIDIFERYVPIDEYHIITDELVKKIKTYYEKITKR